MIREVERTFRTEIKAELLSYFYRVVEEWKHKVRFEATIMVSNKGIWIYVYPVGPNANLWIWTSGGTEPHTITPKGPYPLVFRTEYQPKTRPGYKYRGPGESVGPWVATYAVKHPGTKPREFEKHINRFYLPKFRRRVENALRRGARRL